MFSQMSPNLVNEGFDHVVTARCHYASRKKKKEENQIKQSLTESITLNQRPLELKWRLAKLKHILKFGSGKFK